MQTSAIHFKRKSAAALHNKNLRHAMDGVKDKFISHRAAAVRDYSQNADLRRCENAAVLFAMKASGECLNC